MENTRQAKETAIIEIDTFKKDVLNAISILGEPDVLNRDGERINGLIMPNIDDGEDAISFDAFIDNPSVDYINNYIDFTFNLHKGYLSVFMIIGHKCKDAKSSNEYIDATTTDIFDETGWGVPFESFDGDSLSIACSFDYESQDDLREKLQGAFMQFQNPKFVNWLKSVLSFCD